jgi:hypothetical protein
VKPYGELATCPKCDGIETEKEHMIWDYNDEHFRQRSVGIAER